MYRNGWILLLILICIAFLVSCGKKSPTDTKEAELVRIEVQEDYFPNLFFHARIPLENIDRNTLHWYNNKVCKF